MGVPGKSRILWGGTKKERKEVNLMYLINQIFYQGITPKKQNLTKEIKSVILFLMYTKLNFFFGGKGVVGIKTVAQIDFLF